ncbi:SRPBCC family protein [Nocardiopsis trehalosi]|uniref:SRPBCC family protein n=1 Tax=Nocardiopsis trehalosi TaxID=109329 RepID=UPI00082CC8DE|nr:SRPBCC family protein [Nocardiopsis trehalosi]
MVSVTVRETIRCTPDEFLGLVMDPGRYALIDAKLGPIDWVRRDGDTTDFRFASRLPGLPGPGPRVVSRMVLTPGVRVDASYAPLPANRLVRRFSTFRASFACTPVDGGVRVERMIELGFPSVAGRPLEALLRRTLRPDVLREVRGAKALLEGAGHHPV